MDRIFAGKGGNGEHTKIYVEDKAEYGAATWKLYAKISLEAFIGGFINVFCYLQYNCYPTMMTGQSFTILNGFHHAMDWEKTFQDICIFLVWFAGVHYYSRVANERRSIQQMLPQALMLVYFIIEYYFPNRWFVLIIALSAADRNMYGPKMLKTNTTMMTGNYQKFIQRTEWDEPTYRLLWTWFWFMTGAFMSGHSDRETLFSVCFMVCVITLGVDAVEAYVEVTTGDVYIYDDIYCEKKDETTSYYKIEYNEKTPLLQKDPRGFKELGGANFPDEDSEKHHLEEDFEGITHESDSSRRDTSRLTLSEEDIRLLLNRGSLSEREVNILLSCSTFKSPDGRTLEIILARESEMVEELEKQMLANLRDLKEQVDSESQDFVEDASEFHHPLEQQASSFNDIEEGTLPASILNRENAGEDFDEIQEDWKD